MLSLTSGKSSFRSDKNTGSRCSIVADLPRTGATSMTTDASADRTCCEESAARSLTQGTTAAITLSADSILQMTDTLAAAATLTSASVSRNSLTYAGTSSVLHHNFDQVRTYTIYTLTISVCVCKAVELTLSTQGQEPHTADTAAAQHCI